MCLTRLHRRLLPWCVCAAVAAITPSVGAVPITIFNTGVDPSAFALVGTGTLDTHYSIISPANNTAVTVNDPGYPIPPWLANNSGSRWIGPAGNSYGVPGPWIYRTTFNVPNVAILSTVSVSGDWATDDTGTDVRINGASTGQTDGGYGVLTSFTVNSGFVYGLNTLDFYLTNAAIGINPTGLRVDHIAGSYQVPEPGTAGLAAVAISASATLLRRRRHAPSDT
jgi:PEP-CTERM motif